jgi:predicted Zn-dependent protease
MKLEWMEQYLADAAQMMYSDEVDRGLALMNSLLYDEPGYGNLHNHLGWAYMYYTDDAARAELHLRMAIKFHPEYQAPYLHLGQLLIRLARYAEAIEVLQAGLGAKEANLVTLWDLIGRANEMLGQYSKAIAAYRQAMVLAMADYQMDNLKEGMKRCRRKRWMFVLGQGKGAWRRTVAALF